MNYTRLSSVYITMKSSSCNYARVRIMERTDINMKSSSGNYARMRTMMMMKCCLMSSDVSWHIRDKL